MTNKRKTLIIFVVLSIIASSLNYLAYPLFGRILPPSEYVNITVALSLFTQMSTFLSSITAITIGLSKDEISEETNKKIEVLQALLFKLFLVIATVFLIIAPFIMNKINTPALYAIPISLMMLFSIPIQIISGYLNGKNKMIKLGLVALISASCQFIIGLTIALISKNGLLTMASMTIAQIITLVVIYSIFHKEKLPAIAVSIKMPVAMIRKSRIGKLVIYTLFASLAIMVIGLIQIEDLFIIKSLNQNNAKFYTDIYVISRVVFFAGMIFVWPFLGEISTNNHKSNRGPFLKLLGYFTVIALGAIIILSFFGDKITLILFGANYSFEIVRNVGILSVIYKYLMLIITAVILYFIVARKYLAICIALSTYILVSIYTKFINIDSKIFTILFGLDIISAIIVSVCIILLFIVHISKSKT